MTSPQLLKERVEGALSPEGWTAVMLRLRRQPHRVSHRHQSRRYHLSSPIATTFPPSEGIAAAHREALAEPGGIRISRVAGDQIQDKRFYRRNCMVGTGSRSTSRQCGGHAQPKRLVIR
jgi:hypothetical protein